MECSLKRLIGAITFAMLTHFSISPIGGNEPDFKEIWGKVWNNLTLHDFIYFSENWRLHLPLPPSTFRSPAHVVPMAMFI